MKLLDNLFAYIWSGRGNNCNSYLIAHALRGDSPHVLIDPGHVVNEFNEPCLERLLTLMDRDGFKPEEIGLIINTHSHPDHCEANRSLIERSISGKRQALLAFSKEEDDYRKKVSSNLARMQGKSLEFEPDFYLKEGELTLGKEGKLRLEVLLTPGHSPGSITIYWPDNKVLITGDVIFYGGVGRTDLPGGSGKQLKQSIEKLSQLDVEYLLPGHSTQLGAIVSSKGSVNRNFTSIKMSYFPLL